MSRNRSREFLKEEIVDALSLPRTSHPPVLPVGNLFHLVGKCWQFALGHNHEFVYSVLIYAAEGDFRLIIAALQRAAWLDLPYEEHEDDGIIQILEKAGIKVSEMISFGDIVQICEDQAAAWAQWGPNER